MTRTFAGVPAAAAVSPRALSEGALLTPKALAAATLAVTRAGARLVAVGERGTVLLSDDGGTTWRQGKVPVQATLTAVRFIDERTGWAVGHLGVILKTQDGGANWALQLDGVRAAALQAEALASGGDERAKQAADRWAQEGPDKAFFDIEFTDAQRGLAVGAFNMAFATSDGGKTWTSISARLPNPKSLHLYAVRAHGGKLFVAGEQGLLLQSGNGGANFEALPSPYKGSFFGLLPTRGGALLAYGLRGSVFRSTDLGRQWQKVEVGTPVSIGAGVALNDNRIVLISQAGDILVSRDDGLSFQRHPPTMSLPAAGVASAPDGALVLASLRGTRRQAAP